MRNGTGWLLGLVALVIGVGAGYLFVMPATTAAPAAAAVAAAPPAAGRTNYCAGVKTPTITQAQTEPGVGNTTQPLPHQDWSAFSWVEGICYRTPPPQPATPAGSVNVIYRGAAFTEVGRYSLGGGSGAQGGLPRDPYSRSDDEALVTIIGGLVFAGTNQSAGTHYIVGLHDRLLAVQVPVPWAVVGPNGVIGRGTNLPTDAGFCAQFAMNTACLYLDGETMHAISTDEFP